MCAAVPPWPFTGEPSRSQTSTTSTLPSNCGRASIDTASRPANSSRSSTASQDCCTRHPRTEPHVCYPDDGGVESCSVLRLFGQGVLSCPLHRKAALDDATRLRSVGLLQNTPRLEQQTTHPEANDNRGPVQAAVLCGIFCVQATTPLKFEDAQRFCCNQRGEYRVLFACGTLCGWVLSGVFLSLERNAGRHTPCLLAWRH